MIHELFRLSSAHRYPAGHVFIHHALHDLTDEGTNLDVAQQLYAGLYVLSLFLTCAIYRKAAGIPNWALLLLPLSKRLHSIFVLRMFNDCWAVIGAQLAILAYANDLETLGTTLLRYVLCRFESPLGDSLVQCGAVCQDVGPTLPSRITRCTCERLRAILGHTQCFHDRGPPDATRAAFSHRVSTRVLQRRIRPLARLPVQMDCQLALR